MSFDTTIIAELRKKLEEEKGRLEKEIERLAVRTDSTGGYETRFENLGDNWEENATEVEQYSDNVAVEENLEHQLQEVNEALSRMDAGVYGQCEKGGEDIDIERLRAYPAARTCIQHA